MATITPANSKEDIHSSNTNIIEIPYDISIYVRNDTISTAEGTLRGIVDAIMAALRSDRTLTSTALSSRFEIEW